MKALDEEMEGQKHGDAVIKDRIDGKSGGLELMDGGGCCLGFQASSASLRWIRGWELAA